MLESDELSTTDPDSENKVINLDFIFKLDLLLMYRFFWNHMNIYGLYPANIFDRK